MNLRFIILILACAVVSPVWAQDKAETRAGVGVDAYGKQVIDPTKNVEALVKGLEEKTKELRESDAKLIQAKLDSVEKISELRNKHAIDIDSANARRIDEIEKLRAELNDKLAIAERDRINAIRLVDVGNAADLQRRTSESSTTLQTQTAQLANDLRTQTALLADNLRTLVASTASTAAASQKQAADETSKRLTTIEQALSEGRGKQAVSDPALVALVTEVQKLSQQRALTSGTDAGQSNVVFYLFAGLMALIGLGGLIVAFNKKEK